MSDRPDRTAAISSLARPCGCFGAPINWIEALTGYQCGRCGHRWLHHTQQVSEVERLRVAVHYCRTRLKHPGYRDTLEAILRGDKAESIRNPDLTPVVQS